MAQTFLALFQIGKLTEEERKLVLVPLFRSHGAGAEGKMQRRGKPLIKSKRI